MTIALSSFPLAQLMGWQNIGLIIACVVLLVCGLVVFSFFTTWLRAWLAGAPVTILTLLAMRLRNVPYQLVTDARVMAFKAGIPIDVNALEAHYLANGDLISTVQAIIMAQKANIELDWPGACAIDLATKGTNKSVLEAVKTSINPKVIDCPNPQSGRSTIDGVAKDGIQVKVKARVTVRSNLERYVGNALEETIIARVGEGIVTTIGSADTYKFVLENPDRISKTVLARGLDVGTAFEIISIDIADVDVGENIGAKLQQEQANANKNMAQAQAEIRRAAAVAVEQEMKARVQEMRAKVVGPRPRCLRPLPRACAPAKWVSWITTACKTCRLTPACGSPSPSRRTPVRSPSPGQLSIYSRSVPCLNPSAKSPSLSWWEFSGWRTPYGRSVRKNWRQPSMNCAANRSGATLHPPLCHHRSSPPSTKPIRTFRRKFVVALRSAMRPKRAFLLQPGLRLPRVLRCHRLCRHAVQPLRQRQPPVFRHCQHL
jgi:uncharacterized protein YqfA (UPF0365 family)